MNKIKIVFALLFLMALGSVFSACHNRKTYAEQKEEERKAINRFIDLQNIKVITEAEFERNDSTTDVSKNEFVLFKESGVYMQIVERGNGKLMEDGRHEVLARYLESRIYENGTDSVMSYNTTRPYPDEMTIQKSGTAYSGQFTSGRLSQDYSETAVPTGWLVPFSYIKTGRTIADRAKVRLILPHSENNQTIKYYVWPCYYEITYQLGR